MPEKMTLNVLLTVHWWPEEEEAKKTYMALLIAMVEPVMVEYEGYLGRVGWHPSKDDPGTIYIGYLR